MRALSLNQAQNCETAKGHVCVCRCGGALHGINRGGENPERGFFSSLPEDDPHYLKPLKKKKKVKQNQLTLELVFEPIGENE